MKKYVAIAVAIIIVLLAILGVKVYKKNQGTSQNANVKTEEEIENTDENLAKKEEVKTPTKNIKIFNGNDRPIAFMIDNNIHAQPQSALNRAYLVYEIIVEGGETRLMALFKGVDLSKGDVAVGPIRSARHYFIDYALENDAIYAHLGQSPRAVEYIQNFNVPDINGQVYDTGKARTDSSLYWRVKHKSAPHNAYTSIGSILKIADQKKFAKTSDKESVLNYVENEVNLTSADAINANNVTIPYTSTHTVKYVYDATTQRYTRYSKGKKQTDEETEEDVTTKNLIISFIKNKPLIDGENKDRQDLENFTTAKGYYITNGKAIPIQCEKSFVGGQTQYKDMTGKKIEVNDGNTWINICPIDSNVTIE